MRFVYAANKEGRKQWICVCDQVLYVTINNTGYVLGIPFCLSLFILGNYVMLNLFLAILLSNFDDQFDNAEDSDNDETLPFVESGRNSAPPPRGSIVKLVVMPQKKENQHLYIDEIGYVLNHKNTTVHEEIVSLFRAEKVILYGKSLLCLSPKSSLRIRSAWLVQQPAFELFILVTIFVRYDDA